MKKKILIYVFIILFFTANADAKWSSPTAFINLEFGGEMGQIRLTYTDMGISFPNRFIIDKENHILLPDGDGHYQLFEANGKLIKIISSVEKGFMTLFVDGRILFKGGEDYTLYDFEGNLVNTFKGIIYSGVNIYEVNGTIFVKNKKDKKYYQYSMNGDLLKVYDKRPLALGRSKSRRVQEGYLYERRYADLGDLGKEVKYKLITPKRIRQFKRDKNGFLYAIASGGGKNEIGEIRNDIVYRYDQCGKLIGKMNIPNSIYERTPMPPPHPIGHEKTIVESYGKAVVGPDGDIYTWRALPETYGILKWTWVDSPTDPKGGPDAPETVQANPSTSGVYLTWNPSPQDPGCVAGYDIERATSADGIYSKVTTVPLNEKQTYNYDDTSASAGQTWYYRVKATSDIGDSDAAEASAARP